MIMVMMAKVLIEKMSSTVLEGEVSENIIEESNGCPRHEITGKQFHTISPELQVLFKSGHLFCAIDIWQTFPIKTKKVLFTI